MTMSAERNPTSEPKKSRTSPRKPSRGAFFEAIAGSVGRSAYNPLVTRKILIAGLIVLAALLPLALPPAMLVLVVAFVAVCAAAVAAASAPSLPSPALQVSRAPPSR